MWNFYNELLEVSRKDAKDAKGNVLGTERVLRGLGLGRRAGIPYCVLHTCLRSVVPMELGRMMALKWIIPNKTNIPNDF